ncbi:TPA: DUF2635 domain-containing protein [Yersinia enterocolitica]|uniref:DUF2635 domain-containing protein n=1 Tax=Yersinia enterocolitica TaxID=630 RepID=UPI0005E7FC88|nr:DUF2635 domain-containing protein [Yersinia enterocolitica]CNF82970.1 putative bacteriophage protein [Yersinia enterocolitica]HDL6967022.1 DUF2635 domain-containing protein [Yersinia enterocolitica]HDL6975109.1 DUF2635 domain-containing protein [Yersinia enterocolitica]HDL6996409.1 DUF2635 domain-containing protein [Yersinia enterocolitica]HDL7095396.1 DUF2635 domain-containing protein [Yersinia enterocolitica]
MHVIPKHGRSVPDPVRGDFLPAAGRNVDENIYWHRRIASGEVTVKAAEPEKIAPPAPLVQPEQKAKKQ